MRTDCAERRRLDELYAGAKEDLSKLLVELSRSAGSPQRDIFERTWAACEAQRRLCSQILEQILDHLRQDRLRDATRSTYRQLRATGSLTGDHQIVENP